MRSTKSGAASRIPWRRASAPTSPASRPDRPTLTAVMTKVGDDRTEGRAVGRATATGWPVAAAVALALVPLTIWLGVLSGAPLFSHVAIPGQLVNVAAFAAVGLVITLRRPGNHVGRLVTLIGISDMLANFLTSYAFVGLVTRPGSLPGAALASWVATWAWVAGFVALVIWLPLLFPDGRPPSPWWRPVDGRDGSPSPFSSRPWCPPSTTEDQRCWRATWSCRAGLCESRKRPGGGSAGCPGWPWRHWCLGTCAPMSTPRSRSAGSWWLPSPSP